MLVFIFMIPTFFSFTGSNQGSSFLAGILIQVPDLCWTTKQQSSSWGYTLSQCSLNITVLPVPKLWRYFSSGHSSWLNGVQLLSMKNPQIFFDSFPYITSHFCLLGRFFSFCKEKNGTVSSLPNFSFEFQKKKKSKAVLHVHRLIARGSLFWSKHCDVH